MAGAGSTAVVEQRLPAACGTGVHELLRDEGRLIDWLGLMGSMALKEPKRDGPAHVTRGDEELNPPAKQ